MSESIKQRQNPYPRGQGVGAVPVLFALRNVQPTILNGPQKAQIETTKSVASTAAPAALDIPATPQTETVSTPPKRTEAAKANGNRLYNGAVLVLVLTLCVLVIRNNQSGKSGSLASNDSQKTNLQSTPNATSSSPVPLLAAQSLTATSRGQTTFSPAFFPNAAGAPTGMAHSTTAIGPGPSTGIPNSTGLLPIDLGTAPLELPALANLSNSTQSKQAEGVDEPASDREGILNLVPPSPQSAQAQSMLTAKPALVPALIPALLPAAHSTAMTGSAQIPAKPSKEPTPQKETASDAAPTQDLVDTNETLTTRKLIDLYAQGNTPNNFAAVPNSLVPSNAAIPNQGMNTGATNTGFTPIYQSGPNYQSAPSGGVPAYVASNQGPAPTSLANRTPSNFQPASTAPSSFPQPNVPQPSFPTANAAANNAMIMSGQAYPPVPKDYHSLPIPAYEQSAIDSRQGAPVSTQSASMIRQPSTGGSNRYQGGLIQQPSSNKAPYTPIGNATPPNQSGSSFGYPPGT